VQFSLANGYSKSVRVFAPVVPGRIQVAVPNAISSEVINFGKVEAGRSTERGITVTNRGGIAVPLEFHIPEPFRLLTNPGPQLGSLSEVAISIGLFPAPSARGPVDVTMHVLANEQTVPVRLLANVVPPAGAAPRSGAQPGANLPLAGVRLGSSTPAVPAASNDGVPEGPAGLAADPESSSQRMAPVDPPLSSAIGGAGANNSDGAAPGPSDAGRHSSGDGNQSVAGRVVDPDLRRPEDLSVFEVRSDSIMIGWTSPKDERGRSFEVEGRSVPVGSASGESRSVWVPYPAVKLERIDRLVKAKIEPLNPASQYEFRVVLDGGRRQKFASLRGSLRAYRFTLELDLSLGFPRFCAPRRDRPDHLQSRAGSSHRSCFDTVYRVLTSDGFNRPHPAGIHHSIPFPPR